MRKIAVTLSKGGVGKTTTAVNLAAGLADAGAHVLIVDADTQGQVAKALGVQPLMGLPEVIGSDTPVQEVLVEARPNLWLVAGGQALADVKRQINRTDVASEHVLSNALSPLDGCYDYVILDTSPGWDALSVNVLFYAAEVLCPISLEVLALQSLLDFTQSLNSIQLYHKALQLRYVLPTFMDKRAPKSLQIMERLVDLYPGQISAPIRYSAQLSEAPAYGQTIFEYAPDSAGAEDYRHLARTVLLNP